MTSIALNGVAPYRAVLTHGFVVDVDTKKKISKSAQGAYQKPSEAEHYVNKYGADIAAAVGQQRELHGRRSLFRGDFHAPGGRVSADPKHPANSAGKLA